MKTTNDLVKIVSFGGGVIVDSTKTTADLIKIASFPDKWCLIWPRCSDD